MRMMYAAIRRYLAEVNRMHDVALGRTPYRGEGLGR